jgi:hypothetical protein
LEQNKENGVKHFIRLTVAAVLVCLVVAVVVIQTGFGQNTGGECPELRVDDLGFPLNPPYSEYDAGGTGRVIIPDVPIFDNQLPCCARITFQAVTVGTAPFQTTFIIPVITPVPADGTLRACVPPAQDVSNTDPDGPVRLVGGTIQGTVPPFPANCPAQVTRQVTLLDGRGVVRNCEAGLGGGSVYSTGGNAN